MGWRSFYWRWLALAISRAWAISGLIVGVLRFGIPLVLVPLFGRYFPTWQVNMSDLAWEIPFWVFVGLCFIRIVLAPYWMDQEREQAETVLRAQLEDLRQREAGKQPQIVYDHFDESSVKHPNDGLICRYAHLWFCNRPTGRAALDAAARITVCDSSDRELFAVDGKWMEVQHDLGRAIHGKNKIDLLPNGAAHGLDLLIRAPGAADCYGLHVASNYRGPLSDPRYRLPLGTYTVKVVLSCEGYTEDFWFKVQNEGEEVPVDIHTATI